MKRSPKVSEADSRWMEYAVALARRGEGRTRPNPPVGAVVVRGDRAVGTGYHHRAGEPHAEILALRKAGHSARGATLYVTLEPCSTWGRTGPCTEAIIQSGIQRVVVGVRDPNPSHRGRGLRRLRAQGLRVTCGVERRQAAELIAPFAKWVQNGLPFVTLKLGMTLDGRIADGRGKSRWITGPMARRTVLGLRDRVDAVLIGRTTAACDDPCLLGRRNHDLFRVVVDSHLTLKHTLHMFCDPAAQKTIVATTPHAPSQSRQWLLRRGVTVWKLPARQGKVDLRRLLRRLGHQGCLHVLCEGGGELAADLLRNGLVDRLLLFVCPAVLGGEGVPAIGGSGWLLSRMPRFRFETIRRCGHDLFLSLIPFPDRIVSRRVGIKR